MGPGERLAVIDLGSNSFRLVVFTAGDGWWQRTDEIYEPVRIGEGIAASGRLGEKPIKRALATLDVFAHFCEASGLSPEEIDAVATSAIRDAENAEDFLGMARVRTGLPIRVLSGAAEARYGYLAAINSTTLRDGCVLDLGGGSLQLVQVSDRLARDESGSWRVGAVRMTERFLPGGGIPKQKQLDELREYVAQELGGAAWLTAADGHLVGIGGTVRNLAAAAQRCAGEPSNGVQGVVLSAAALGRLVDRLAELPAAERSRVPGIKPARSDLILAGAVVVQEALRVGGYEGIEITEAGLREGVFFERYLGGDGSPSSSRPPLFEDVRRSSVQNLASRYHVDVAHTRHVAKLALGMFDQLAELGLHPGDPVERELLWAASQLHDIGMSVDYDDHHKHSRYLILNGSLPGFSPVEVALVAQAARYHRKGMPEPGPLAALFAAGDAERLDRLAVLLRLAEDLERSRDQLVRETRLTLSREGADGDCEVQLRLIADGEAAVPRWAAGRETGLFTRAFGCRLEVL
ncbi:MAG TPA: Ppx/GppA phosphatase family protein [Solirubrobacteraceae bacterium]|jgi:exopolyphosphatase/guanosine-5'-triphosphate,3'-diphosphate pyrophosphatase